MRLYISSQKIVDGDRRQAANELAERGSRMVAAGLLDADYMTRCWNLAEVRKMVEGAEYNQAVLAELDAQTDPRIVAERDLDQWQAETVATRETDRPF